MPSPSDRLYNSTDDESDDSVAVGDEGRKPKRKARKGLSDEELQSIIRTHITGAIDYRDTVLAPDRSRVQAYFEGDEDLDGDLPARKGRSKYVSRDVSETINQVLPDLVDIFLSDEENVVEFIPLGPEDSANAKAATQYVNYLIRKHGGLQLFYPVFMDALKSKVGVVRYWWDESKTVEEEEYEGLSPDEFAAITTPDPDEYEAVEIEVIEKEEHPTMIDQEIPPAPGMPPGPPQIQKVPSVLIDCRIKRTKKEAGIIKIAAVPPEERLIDENARSLGTASFWGHARNVHVGELVSLGFDEDEIEDLWEGDAFLTNQEAEERENAGLRTFDDGKGDASMKTVPYAEVFLRSDLYDEGALSVWRICVGGAQAKLLSEPERVKDIGVAEFLSQPIEHVATGKAYAENIVPLAGLRTSLWRGMLDSLSQAIFPQRGFQETLVNVNDLMNDEPGALVRCKASPSTVVQEFVHPFTGADVLGVLQYTDQVKENRTGVSRTTSGLDPNILQSTAKEAASHTVSASQKQIKMLARILAEWGMKTLAKGVLRLITTKQTNPEAVRLMGDEWTTFDPRQWNPDMDCITRVGTGESSSTDQSAILQSFLAVQKELVMAKSPLVDERKIYNTLDALVKLTRHRDTSRFFNPPPPQQAGPAPQQPQGPTPEMALAEAEKMKAATERASAEEKNTNDRIRLLLEDDRERDRMEMDFTKAIVVEQMKAGLTVNLEQLRAGMNQQIARERNYSELAARAQAANSPVGQTQQQQPGMPQ